ncbi:MAG: hypothetical protein ABI664_15780 [bacterium]
MQRKSAPSRVAEPALARKNMDMDVAKLDAVRAILGARTDTETVDRALDYVLFQGEVSAALEHLYDLGGLDDPLPRATTTRRAR